MPKSKKKRPLSSSGAATSADPRQQGLKAFHANSFGAALKAWSLMPQDDPQVQAAMAEAHFRRALTETSSSTDQLADLRQAVELAPGDMRYRYHLGLALHRSGDLDAAIECYHTVLQKEPSWSNTAMVLALATLTRDPQVDMTTLPGSNTHSHTMLAPVQMLLCGKRPEPPAENSSDGVMELFWYGLGCIRQRDGAASEPLSDDRQLPSAQATAIRRYYKGVAAAQVDDMETALKYWQRAGEHPAMITPWLRDNIITILTQQLTRQLEADDLTGAKETVQIALRMQLSNNALNDMMIATLDHIAQAAAAEGKWQSAVVHWEDARQILSGNSSLGSPRPLLHNLALAYEHMENWGQAAEMWRAMLRTRPRKTSKASDGPTDEQWSWVRKRVIECYKRAGTPDEAVAVFRQAIKADPDDLDMRIQLADALLANQQEQASYNELQRILELEPNHVDAHLRIAELHQFWGQWRAAEQSLRRVMELQPEREDVRRQVARLMLSRGNNLHNSRLFAEARKIFAEGQKLFPDNYQFPLNLARIAIDERKYDQAQALLDRTLELGAELPETYAAVIECWAVADEIDRAREVLARAEQNLPAAPEMYLLIGLTLVEHSTPPPELPPFGPFTPQPRLKKIYTTDSVWMEMATETLNRAIALRPDDAQLRVVIAERLKLSSSELALRYAQEAVERIPDDPDVLILLGIIQALNDQDREAKDTLRRASKLARQQGKHDIVEQANAMRQQVGSPFLRVSIQMAEAFGDLDIDEIDPDFDLFP